MDQDLSNKKREKRHTASDMMEEKMAMARENNDIEKITEYRYNIKQLALKGQLSKQTKEYVKEKYYYLGIN